MLLWFALLVNAVLGATTISYQNFTNEFSLEMYATYEKNQTILYNLMRFKKPMPSWHEDMWLGIGYNTKTMDSADLVMCKWTKNKASCADYWNNRFPGRPEDDVQDDIRIYRAEWKYTEYLEIGFKRPYNTSDLVNDELLPYGMEIPMIWAYGNVTEATGVIEKHYGRGVSFIKTPVKPGYSTVVSYFTALLTLLAIV